jgi:membrane protease YdiL (CAAX protease family)
MKVWGYWATLGWAALAFFVGQFAALAAYIWWRPGSLSTLMETPYDGILITFVLFVSNPITIAVIALAARLARAGVSNYLALVWPHWRDVAIGVASLVALIAVGDALLYLGGEALVTPFQLQSYSTAQAEGWLAAMLIATIIVAPAGEEIMFRGFLFRGWARSEPRTLAPRRPEARARSIARETPKPRAMSAKVINAPPWIVPV